MFKRFYFIGLVLALLAGCSKPQPPVIRTGHATADDAGKAALTEIYFKARGNGWEWGGIVYRAVDGTFGYTEPVTQENSWRVNVAVAITSLPAGNKSIAMYHNHPDASQDFSSLDKDNLWMFFDYGYLVNHFGAMRKYTSDHSKAAQEGKVEKIGNI